MTGLGKAIEQAVIGAIVMAALAGGAVALGGYFLVTWLAAHLTVSWR